MRASSNARKLLRPCRAKVGIMRSVVKTGEACNRARSAEEGMKCRNVAIYRAASTTPSRSGHRKWQAYKMPQPWAPYNYRRSINDRY